MVYVDDADIPYKGMVMSHCWADNLSELLAMMDKIGVNRKWIQGHPTLSLPEFRKASWVHFDISLGKKKMALRYGAVLTDRFGPLEHVARITGNRAMTRRVILCRWMRWKEKQDG